MRCSDHLQLLTAPTASDLDNFALIEKQARESISSEQVMAEYVQEVMTLFRSAYAANREVFITEIFFQNQLALRSTQVNQDYIFDLFEAAKALPDGQRKQIQLVNIYRNMVSDLFEPYLSILVACLQLKEGTFQSFDAANLGATEFQKYQYAYSRLKPTNMFKGYIPLIRNSASHTGSHGVRYVDEEIIFYKIKRGTEPVVTDNLSVTIGELAGYIQYLTDLTQSIDVAINIMGIDMGHLIWTTRNFAQAFQETLITRETLSARHDERQKGYQQIWADRSLTYTEKIEHFRNLYAIACKKNELPIKFLRTEDRYLIVVVPWKKLFDNSIGKKVNRAAELCQYAILAEMYFHHQFSDYMVEELREPGEESLQIWQGRADLNLYNKGGAHVLDLLQDGKLYVNYTYQPLQVSFDLLDADLLENLSKQRRRKIR